MSTYLTLFPFLKGPQALRETFILCETKLEPIQDYSIYAQIDVLSFTDESVKPHIKTEVLPAQLWIGVYIDEGIERTRESTDGEELRFVYAQALKKWKIPGDAHWQMKAVKAYIDELPNDIPILLYIS